MRQGGKLGKGLDSAEGIAFITNKRRNPLNTNKRTAELLGRSSLFAPTPWLSRRAQPMAEQPLAEQPLKVNSLLTPWVLLHKCASCGRSVCGRK